MADRENSTDVAQQADTVRADLAQTLAQLRENLKPENVIEDVVDTARVGVSSVADGLFGLAREYPLPALLIGAGCAMIMGLGSTMSLKRRKLIDLRPEAVSQPIGGIDSTLLADVRSSRAGPIRDETGAWVPYRKGQVWPLDDEAASTTPRKPKQDHETAPAKSFASRETQPGMSGVLREQPLIIAALGVAVGAAIGVSLPITKVEDEWMGGVSSSVKRAAQDAARHEIDEIKAVASRTRDNLMDPAGHDASDENLDDVVRGAVRQADPSIGGAGRRV